MKNLLDTTLQNSHNNCAFHHVIFEIPKQVNVMRQLLRHALSVLHSLFILNNKMTFLFPHTLMLETIISKRKDLLKSAATFLLHIIWQLHLQILKEKESRNHNCHLEVQDIFWLGLQIIYLVLIKLHSMISSTWVKSLKLSSAEPLT